MARVTEKKRVKISHECVEHPVYLNWLGVSGGRNYWLFGKRQEKTKQVEVKGVAEPSLRDIETAKGYLFETGREVYPRLTLGAVVDAEDAEGIYTILDSPHVLMLMNPDSWQTDGPIWQVVRPLAGTYKEGFTDESRKAIEFTIDIPSLNIQGT